MYKSLDTDKNILIEYLRNKKGNRIGVVVAIDKNTVGWSLCNSLDQFDRDKGLYIAIARASKAFDYMKNGDWSIDDVKFIYYQKCPHTLKSLLDKMIDRSILYYKE